MADASDKLSAMRLKIEALAEQRREQQIKETIRAEYEQQRAMDQLRAQMQRKIDLLHASEKEKELRPQLRHETPNTAHDRHHM